MIPDANTPPDKNRSSFVIILGWMSRSPRRASSLFDANIFLMFENLFFARSRDIGFEMGFKLGFKQTKLAYSKLNTFTIEPYSFTTRCDSCSSKWSGTFSAWSKFLPIISTPNMDPCKLRLCSLAISSIERDWNFLRRSEARGDLGTVFGCSTVSWLISLASWFAIDSCSEHLFWAEIWSRDLSRKTWNFSADLRPRGTLPAEFGLQWYWWLVFQWSLT